MWTDVAASAVVGTKGTLGPYNQEPDQAARVKVLPIVHRVKYRWAFGIPAFIVVLIMGIVAVTLLVSAVTGRSSVGIMRHRLKQVSLGRALTTVFCPNSSSFTMSPSEWSKVNGGKEVDVASGRPVPVSQADAPRVMDNENPVFTQAPQRYAAVPQQMPAQQFSPQPYVQPPPQQWRGSPDAISPEGVQGATYLLARKD